VSCFSSPFRVGANATPNFSGTWTLDVAATGLRTPDSVVMVGVDRTDHQDDDHSEGCAGRRDREHAHTDGKENVNKLRAMGGEQDVSRTKWNGRKLATARTLEIQDITINMNDAWGSPTTAGHDHRRTIGAPQETSPRK
jgi:hypothetical protein